MSLRPVRKFPQGIIDSEAAPPIEQRGYVVGLLQGHLQNKESVSLPQQLLHISCPSHLIWPFFYVDLSTMMNEIGKES